jgi:hypothetical protein
MHVENKSIPNTPSNLFATTFGSNIVRLSWLDNSSKEDAFIVCRYNNPIAMVPADVESYMDTVTLRDSEIHRHKANRSPLNERYFPGSLRNFPGNFYSGRFPL